MNKRQKTSVLKQSVLEIVSGKSGLRFRLPGDEIDTERLAPSHWWPDVHDSDLPHDVFANWYFGMFCGEDLDCHKLEEFGFVSRRELMNEFLCL